MMSDMTTEQMATAMKKTQLIIVKDIAHTLESEGLMTIDIEELLSQYYRGLHIVESDAIDIVHNYQEEEDMLTLR